MPTKPTTPTTSLSDLIRSTRIALVGFGAALYAGLTIYGEYHLGSS